MEQNPSPTSVAVDIRTNITGEVLDDPVTLKKFSRDTSIFARTPTAVVFPKNKEDVASTVRIVREANKNGAAVSITGRSAGSDMTGGPLSRSIVMSFTEHINQITEVGDGYAVTEPGVFYRDFEKATLKKGRQILPSYPASRELAAMGGLLNNNSGGERTLEYGKTEDYIESVDVVLSDGSFATLKELTLPEVEKKKQETTLEGSIYREMDSLLRENQDRIHAAKPTVSKNSAGYALWSVVDQKRNTFNLAKLICGSQGTLALTTSMRLRLVKDQPNRAMLVIFLSDLSILPQIVHAVLPFNPESFESYDDHTFSLAIRFLPQMLMRMGPVGALRLGLSFLPEVGLVLRGGIPKLVLMAEFSEDTAEEAIKKASEAQRALSAFSVQTRINKNEKASEKYWKIRRESFALLRKNTHGLYAAPFIDDFVVDPNVYPEFLPRLNTLLDEYKDKFVYTIAGHVGNGNFHIIPLVDMKKEENHAMILELMPRVYALILEYKGTITGEHNDGIIRTPYLRDMFGDDMIALFEKTKHIFDPDNIFNPGKKVGGTLEDIKRDMVTNV